MKFHILLTPIFTVATILVMSLNACASDGVPSVSPVEFEQQIKTAKPDSIVILDVRTPQEYADGHLRDAVNLDWLNPEAFAAGAKHLDPSKHYYVYCRSGRRSLEACHYLARDGFTVTDLAGGILAWQTDGLPIVGAPTVK